MEIVGNGSVVSGKRSDAWPSLLFTETTDWYVGRRHAYLLAEAPHGIITPSISIYS